MRQSVADMRELRRVRLALITSSDVDQRSKLYCWRAWMRRVIIIALRTSLGRSYALAAKTDHRSTKALFNTSAGEIAT